MSHQRLKLNELMKSTVSHVLPIDQQRCKRYFDKNWRQPPKLKMKHSVSEDCPQLFCTSSDVSFELASHQYNKLVRPTSDWKKTLRNQSHTITIREDSIPNIVPFDPLTLSTTGKEVTTGHTRRREQLDHYIESDENKTLLKTRRKWQSIVPVYLNST